MIPNKVNGTNVDKVEVTATLVGEVVNSLTSEYYQLIRELTEAINMAVDTNGTVPNSYICLVLQSSMDRMNKLLFGVGNVKDESHS